MANPFTNFLGQVVNGSGNLRDYQHASRLYTTNNYELTPKAGWLYYVVININPEVIYYMNMQILPEFQAWLNRYKTSVGLLSKQVDLPKFSLQTETLNQYNKKTIVQKQITYNPVSLVFHDDHANVTTNLWKYYFQYYYADSISKVGTSVIPKYEDTKYQEVIPSDYAYGFNNKQQVPFFTSIDVYQLHQKKYTSFKLVNPIIKGWDHDQLDQTQGNKLLTSKMTVEYETVIYNTEPINYSSVGNPGFAQNYYDLTPSPLSIGGNGTNSIFGPGGIIAGASDVFGNLQKLGTASPLDILNTAIKGANLVKNVKSVNKAGLKEEGYSILNSTLAGAAATPANIGVDIYGNPVRVPVAAAQVGEGAVSGLTKSISPVGINLSTNNLTNTATPSSQVKFNGNI